MLKEIPIQPLSNIYVALGSNEGNKFEFLQKAVDAIFNNIGTILKISPTVDCMPAILSSLPDRLEERTASAIIPSAALFK